MNNTIEITEIDIQKALNREIYKLNNGIITTYEYFLNVSDIYRKFIPINGGK